MTSSLLPPVLLNLPRDGLHHGLFLGSPLRSSPIRNRTTFVQHVLGDARAAFRVNGQIVIEGRGLLLGHRSVNRILFIAVVPRRIHMVKPVIIRELHIKRMLNIDSFIFWHLVQEIERFSLVNFIHFKPWMKISDIFRPLCLFFFIYIEFKPHFLCEFPIKEIARDGHLIGRLQIACQTTLVG